MVGGLKAGVGEVAFEEAGAGDGEKALSVGGEFPAGERDEVTLADS